MTLPRGPYRGGLLGRGRVPALPPGVLLLGPRRVRRGAGRLRGAPPQARSRTNRGGRPARGTDVQT